LTATPYGKNRVHVSVYDSNGETVATMLPGGSDLIVHSFTYSSNPFTDNGSNILNIYDSNGHSFAQWDGKNTGGSVVPGGVYFVHVVTTDPSGNTYVVDQPLDIISVGVNSMQGFFMHDNGRNGGYIIQAQVATAEWVKIRIYNLAGEYVKGFTADAVSGQFSFNWNERTTSGAMAACGIYVVVIEVKDGPTGYVERRIEKLYIK
jgi:flagellar hook assembly protein FlgD